MIQTPLKKQYKVRVNIRPIKVAYFVRDDDFDGLCKVMKNVCTQWGGMRNLIIPIKTDLSTYKLFESLLHLHEPDRFVEYLTEGFPDNYDKINALQKYVRSILPERDIVIQPHSIFEQFDDSAHALHVFNAENLRDHTLVLPRLKNSEAEWLELALYGGIYPGQESDYQNVITLRSENIDVDDLIFWTSQYETDTFSSPLNLTSYNIHPYKATDHFDTVIFNVIFANSVSSICMYWNLRATREATQFATGLKRRTLLLPISLVDDDNAFGNMLAFIRNNWSYPNISSNLQVMFSVWDDADKAKIETKISKTPELEKLAADKITVSHSWSNPASDTIESLVGKRLSYAIGLPDRPVSYFEGIGMQPAVALNLEERINEFLFEPPSSFHNLYGNGVALDFESEVWKRYPHNRFIAENIKNGAWFSRYGLSGVFTLASRPQYLSFNLPTELEALGIFFSQQGMSIQSSKSGQYAEALVNLVGGWSQVNIFVSMAVYTLLDILALKSTKKIAQRIAKDLNLEETKVTEIRRVLDEVETIQELKGVVKTYSNLRSEQRLAPYRSDLIDILSRLCRAQVLRRGYYLSCPNCGAPDWYPVDRLSENLKCTGCSHVYMLPVECLVEYRLNTLVNRAVDQDVLPHILAAFHVIGDKEYSCLCLGLELHQNGQAKAEFDFVVSIEQDIYAGECKTGMELSDKDFESALLAAKLGISKYFFCTMQTFSAATMSRIDMTKKEVENQGHKMELIVLSGDALLTKASLAESQAETKKTN